MHLRCKAESPFTSRVARQAVTEALHFLPAKSIHVQQTMDRLKKAITRGRARLIYRPLQSNEIRILTLKPGSGPDPIACTLRHVSLDDQPEYEALSYTWGDPKNTRKILVDGKKLQVTANLFDALENFRDPQQRIVLWVDAICVNQCDLAERGQQVKLMRRVFSQGRRTKVWLGLEDNDSDLATDFLEETLSGFNDGRNFEKELSALSQLFQRPWWFRIWVVQEVVVSKNLAFFCGKRQISWPKVSLVNPTGNLMLIIPDSRGVRVHQSSVLLRLTQLVWYATGLGYHYTFGSIQGPRAHQSRSSDVNVMPPVQTSYIPRF